ALEAEDLELLIEVPVVIRACAGIPVPEPDGLERPGRAQEGELNTLSSQKAGVSIAASPLSRRNMYRSPNFLSFRSPSIVRHLAASAPAQAPEGPGPAGGTHRSAPGRRQRASARCGHGRRLSWQPGLTRPKGGVATAERGRSTPSTTGMDASR